LLQTLAHISQIAGGLVFLVAAGTYLIHRNQLNFNMIMNCNQRFQEIMVDLEGEDEPKARRAKKRYVDLCNEQIFYFGNGYLPREVIEEWLESMIDYLPLFDEVTGEVLLGRSGVVEPKLLEDYPTIKRVFTVNGSHDLTSRDQRMVLVRQIGKRVKPEPIPHVIWRDIVDHFHNLKRGEGAKTTTTSGKTG
jgi:hypothetical protein